MSSLQGKAVEANKQRTEKRKKPRPEEQEGMPQHQRFTIKKIDLSRSEIIIPKQNIRVL
jgi:hypothetical protein